MSQTSSDQKFHGIFAEYDSVDSLLEACRRVRDAGYKKTDAFAPFAVHGIDEALGIKPTVLPWIAFGGGLTGTLLALTMQIWMNAINYPYIISGKPFVLSLPAFMPVTFELTVLLASVYMQPMQGWDELADVRSMDWPSDVVRFEYSNGSLTLIDEDIRADLLGSAVSARDFGGVLAALDTMPQADWAWVDFAIGVRMVRAAEPEKLEATWKTFGDHGIGRVSQAPWLKPEYAVS